MSGRRRTGQRHHSVVEGLYYSLPHDIRRTLHRLLKRYDHGLLQGVRQGIYDEGGPPRPFDTHECIFVHIPKTGGTSINRTLYGNLGGRHTSIRGYQAMFCKRDFDRYFKFTFVRNPWDRVFSAYTFLEGGGATERDRRWAETTLDSIRSFEQFVTRALPRPGVRRQLHFIPQSDFLDVPGCRSWPIDFVGLFENLEEDFRSVAERLSLSPPPALRHDNKSADLRDYKDQYTDETRAIVADVYERDIELFGYTFDNSSLDEQLRARPLSRRGA